MSYQVLARKWRPQTFADVVGQEHVLTALANGLSLGRIHHAYLFSGTRGVGKTSIARLLAKGLNCETGITATPCGVCDNCREIEQGRFVDLIEIDAASRTKVEDTRDLLDNVQYAPARGRFKVYLIDEVHMLSRHSFNALLKTLEEPPAHVKFLLATTDPQKLPVTILSRCLQFHLKALDVEQIRHQLEHILGEEQIAFEPRALQLLSRAADGSLRDALSLTDQAIASGEGQLTAASVSTMLGTLDDDQALSLIEALVAADGERVMAGVNDAAARGVEWEALLVEMQSLLHRIAMVQLSPSALGADMAAVDDVIRRELASDVRRMHEIGEYITSAGGKRMRPALLMLIARALGYEGTLHQYLGATIELLHTATLMHDDVVDESDMRRGRPTANARWGNGVAVLVGDFLYTRSFQMMVKAGNLKVMEALSNAANRLSEGEVIQMVNAHDPTVDEERYFKVIERKTACLFEAGARMAAAIAEASPEAEEAVAEYALALGNAFQIADDMLDYAGDAAETGKSLGADLREGKVTLPLIYTRELVSEEDRRLIDDAIRQGDGEFDKIAKLVIDCEALDRCRARAEMELERGRKALSKIPSSIFSESLLELLSFTVKRDR